MAGWLPSFPTRTELIMITQTDRPSETVIGKEHDLYFLDLTLALAAKGEGQVRPNPLVGAVVVKDGLIVGQGFHRYDGVKHAEVLALEEAGQLAKGATVYTNLEPCSHRGGGKRTPPCCDALIAAQVRRVVCCITDPNPRVNGRGVAVLREADIAVSVGQRISAARLINAEYLRAVITSNTSPASALMQLLF
jgi:diaminohydroxyphosphoribosylaminopyrimidine deaminase / 5-amino-6-(5-phosphoribosylamino)uracil reductase